MIPVLYRVQIKNVLTKSFNGATLNTRLLRSSERIFILCFCGTKAEIFELLRATAD